ncbi:cation:dicarboxylase symporter family transporter [Corynebacterium sp.]|uniref:cation:dicarboxylate symporter family transporter n=1 Tax=Corynebacterium sp. TaxID=1720 RepID=UPI0025C6D227|nr:cation:dicarboxylase symporter family transporter [Corynebacterium sp.]
MTNEHRPEATGTAHGAGAGKNTKPKDKSHWLYLSVLVAVVAGIVVGLIAPGVGEGLKPLGTMFVSLIKMVIPPIIFCTIVIGIGHVREAATVGKAGGIALIYFLLMSTLALGIGLVVGNFIQPGEGLGLAAGEGHVDADAESAGGFFGFIQNIIPDTIVSAFTDPEQAVLQTLFVALLVGFALQSMPNKIAGPCLYGIELAQKVVFKVMSMILWVAPVGAFGAMAFVVGGTGVDAIWQLMTLMVGFYVTCVLFIVLVLGTILRASTGLSIFKVLRYLGREYLLIVGTSSSESALPQLMQKMEFAGVDKATVGIVVPTGYSFNLDGTAIYLTMASIFIADAMNISMGLGEQVGLLVFMIIASKGAAGVSGAGIAALAAGLQAHRPEMLGGVDVIVGIDRFMSEARSLTNFTGNAVATLLVGKWTKSLDIDQANAVLDREKIFEYTTDDEIVEPVGASPQPADQKPSTERWQP